MAKDEEYQTRMHQAREWIEEQKEEGFDQHDAVQVAADASERFGVDMTVRETQSILQQS